jgi:hypothetical protein
MSKTTAETLRKAKALIDDQGKWIRGGLACDSHGHPCEPHNPDAVCFCALGALQAAIWHVDADRNIAYPAAIIALRDAGALNAGFNVASTALTHFNDSHGHAEVMALFDVAIAQQEASP